MVPFEVEIEARLAGSVLVGTPPDLTFPWVSLMDDVINDPIVVQYGIRRADPATRIAEPGSLTFTLDNSHQNSGGVLGYYSMLNQAAVREGWQQNIEIRLRLRLVEPEGAFFNKFFGRLAKAPPATGELGERIVRCVVVDLFQDWMDNPAPSVPVQFGQDGGALMSLFLNALPAELQPALTSITTGVELHPVAFDAMRPDTMTAYQAAHDIAMSDFGRLYLVGTNAEPGQLLRYQTRQESAAEQVWMILSDDIIAEDGLQMSGDRSELINRIQLTMHPTRFDVGPGSTLWASETSTLMVRPGETVTLYAAYRNPSDRGQLIGGTDMITPVPTDDFLFDSLVTLDGTDMTSSVTVTADFESGTGTTLRLTNTGVVEVYKKFLRVRGRGIYRFDHVIEAEVTPEYGPRLLRIEMPFQSDINVGMNTVNYLITVLSSVGAQYRVESVKFLANETLYHLAVTILVEPGMRVWISESVSGLSFVEFTVTGVRMDIEPGNILWCTWFVEPADIVRYWIHATEGAANLGASTVLGY